MLIDISDIVFGENKEMTETVPLELTAFSSRLGEFPITGKTPVELQIANQENRKLKICGTADLTIAIPCGRCLAEVPTELHLDIDRTLRLAGSAVTEEDGTACEASTASECTAGSDDGEVPDYLDGWKLDTERLIYGEILVNWPARVLCRADCRGICKVCGADLNQGDCGCSQTVPDPRMAAIQDIFNKFKEV